MNGQLNPGTVPAAKRMESSLKRCSTNQHRKSDEDTAFNQTEKKMNGQSNTRPVSAATRIESSLKRFCTNQQRESDKDTAFNQIRKNMNRQSNPGTVPAATHKKSYLERWLLKEYNKSVKEAAFSQAGKDTIDRQLEFKEALIRRIMAEERTGFRWHKTMTGSGWGNIIQKGGRPTHILIKPIHIQKKRRGERR
ncbi:uncharacterized protein LOC141607021 [Silene latifolia]|uniref:uncharacterized protein LOC141607021 n=1 Tax=Silene latifolia TaxID=37657 RepID=UPI003D774C81